MRTLTLRRAMKDKENDPNYYQPKELLPSDDDSVSSQSSDENEREEGEYIFESKSLKIHQMDQIVIRIHFDGSKKNP